MWSYHSGRGVAPSTFTTKGVAAKFNITPRKMVAKEDDPTSYWEGNFSGTMLNFGRPQGRRFGGPFPDNSRAGSTNFIAFLPGFFLMDPGKSPYLDLLLS